MRLTPIPISQIYPLRAFSAFWLTAAKPVPLKMANTCVIRNSPTTRGLPLSRPRGLIEAAAPNIL